MKPVLVSLVLGLLTAAPPQQATAPPPRAVAPPSQAPSAAQDETPFVLGVLRRDGVVLPFASFTGKDWETRWPDDLRWTELPLLLGDVPDRWWGKTGLPSQFTIWNEGEARGTLQLDRPVMVSAACERRLGVTSTYRASEIPPPPAVRPYPKDGLVISGPQRIAAIEEVPHGSPVLAAITTTLIEPMDQAEQSAINRFSDWNHPLSRKERKKVPVEIEALYRAPMDVEGWSAYHVEAVKRYAPGKGDEGCGLMTSASGWVVIGPKGKDWKHWVELTARVTYCDRQGVAYFLPLGLMHLRDRTYWIFQTSGYQVERYDVVRPTPKRIEFEAGYSAGTCGGF